MAIHFNYSLPESLKNIDYVEHNEEFIVHDNEEIRVLSNSCDIIEQYGEMKHQVVSLINEVYGKDFDLKNWIRRDLSDEVAFFLNESGSNVLNYSQFKAPSKFGLFFGKKGFIIGIEQKGKSFNAKHIHDNNIKENEGMAFKFYKQCSSKIFFDHPQDTNIVYLEFLF
jgi:hypothetical protein